MTKRYQIFVSSTYADLKDERAKVLQTLMEMDCIPAGMELFPAADEEQWEFIKKVIDDCDYYLLIIGGRYGSLTQDGISYTEKEYQYAVDNNVKIIALLHSDPNLIPMGKTDQKTELQEKLLSFREKVLTGRLVKFWKESAELPGLVSLSLTKTIKTYPAIGWVRADKIGNSELLSEMNSLRKINSELLEKINKIENNNLADNIEDIAELHEIFRVSGKSGSTFSKVDWNGDISWAGIFGSVAPFLLQYQTESFVRATIASRAASHAKVSNYQVDIDEYIFQAIKIQLMALNYVVIEFLKTADGNFSNFWKLTNSGKSAMLKYCSIKRKGV